MKIKSFSYRIDNLILLPIGILIAITNLIHYYSIEPGNSIRSEAISYESNILLDHTVFLPIVGIWQHVPQAPMLTKTSTWTPTQIITPTSTNIPSPEYSGTPTHTTSGTATPTSTQHPTSSRTPTSILSPTPGYTSTATSTSSPTAAPTSTPSPTSTPTNLSSSTPTVSPTPTAVPKIGFYAIIASAQNCPDSVHGGMRFYGPGGSVDIFGGDIFSNACIEVNSVEVYLEIPYDSYCVGDDCYDTNGGGGMDPLPIPVDTPLDISYLGIPEPECDKLPYKGFHEGGGIIEPGIYSNIRISSGELIMTKGLYCLEHDFYVIGGSLGGEEVTIYMQNGIFASSGASSITLSSPLSVDEAKDGILDVLFYVGETSQVTLLGNGDSTYTGVVYSPGHESRITLGGTGSLIGLYNVQLIGGSIRINTAADIAIVFDPDHGYPK